jgi:hypothetical protein
MNFAIVLATLKPSSFVLASGLSLASLGLLALFPAKGADLSTAGVERLAPFFNKTELPDRPITILSFGDSMADSYRSISCVLMHRFADRLGVAGHSLNAFADGNYYRLTNGAVAVGPDRFWFETHQQIPPGGGVWWDAFPFPGGIWSDRVGLFFVAHPTGGVMTLSVSTNGGPWTALLTVNAYAPSPEGRFTNLSLALDFHRLRVDGQSGTNVVLGAQLLNSHSNGVHTVFTDEPGISLSDVTNVPEAIRLPVFRAVSPDLLIWHMKEDSSDATRQGLIECESWWSNAVPDCSVIYIGTPYVSLDTNSTWTADQNTLVRSVALSFNRTYMDCMTPAVSYPWMVSQGFMSDGTHENVQGNTYLAGFAWDSLGFFALRRPRTLAVQRGRDGFNLTYPTATNILYTIESSDDTVHWQAVFSQPGDGLPGLKHFPIAASRQFFRLRLSPNN